MQQLSTLRMLRTLLHLNQQQVAKQLNISQGQYQKLECGDKELSLTMLKRLSVVFGLPAAMLLQCLLADTPTIGVEDAIHIINNPIKLTVIEQYNALLSICSLVNDHSNSLSDEIKKLLAPCGCKNT